MRSSMSTAGRQKISPWRQVRPSAPLGPKTQTSHQWQYVWVLGRAGHSMTACRKSPKCDWPWKSSWRKQAHEIINGNHMSSWYCYHGPFQRTSLTWNPYHVEVTICWNSISSLQIATKFSKYNYNAVVVTLSKLVVITSLHLRYFMGLELRN